MAEHVPMVSAPSIAGGDASGDNVRLQQIMTNDVYALVKTVKDIELTISKYHDRSPPWAEAIASRLGSIESRWKTLDAEVRSGKRAGPASSTDGTVDADKRLSNKFKTEVTSKANVAKYALETRILAITVELDRLNSLLQIRPTTSELTSVSNIIVETRERIKETCKQSKKELRSFVASVISVEIQGMIEQIRQNDKMGEAVQSDINNKVNEFTKEMSRMRNGIATIVHDIVVAGDKTNQLVLDLYDKNEANAAIYNQYYEHEQLSIAYMNGVHDSETKIFNEFKDSNASIITYTNNTIDSIIIDTNLMYDRLTDIESSVREVDTNLKDEFTYFKENVGFSLKELKGTLDENENALFKFQSDLKSTQAAAKVFDAALIVKSFDRIDKGIEDNRVELEEAEDLVNTSEVKTSKLLKVVSELLDEGKLVPPLLQHLKAEIDMIESVNASKKKQVDTLLRTMNNLNKELDDILEIQAHVVKLSEDLLRSEEVVATNSDAYDNHRRLFSQNDQTMTDSSHMIEKNSEENSTLAEEITSELSMKIEKKAMDVYLQLRETQDNIAIIEKQSMGDQEKSISQTLLSGLGTGAGAGKKVSKWGNVRGNLDGIVAGNASIASTSASVGNSNIISENDIVSLLDETSASIDGISSGIGMSEREQRDTSYNQMHTMAKLCQTYEQLSLQAQYVNDIPPNVTSLMTSCCQALTAFFSTCVDAETVQRVLKPTQSLGESSAYSEDTAVVRRNAKIDEFVIGVESCVAALTMNATPGPIRAAARKKFISQLKSALDLCMSKHSQVIVVGTSSFGKMKYPTADSQYCVTVEARSVALAPSHMVMGNSSRFAKTGDDSDDLTDTDSAAMRRPIMNQSGNLQRQFNTLKVPIHRIGFNDTATATTATAANAHITEIAGQPYVLRSGFKLPRGHVHSMSQMHSSSSSTNLSTGALPLLRSQSPQIQVFDNNKK